MDARVSYSLDMRIDPARLEIARIAKYAQDAATSFYLMGLVQARSIDKDLTVKTYSNKLSHADPIDLESRFTSGLRLVEIDTQNHKIYGVLVQEGSSVMLYHRAAPHGPLLEEELGTFLRGRFGSEEAFRGALDRVGSSFAQEVALDLLVRSRRERTGRKIGEFARSIGMQTQQAAVSYFARIG